MLSMREMRLMMFCPPRESRNEVTLAGTMSADAKSVRPARVRIPALPKPTEATPCAALNPGAAGMLIAAAASTRPDRMLYSREPGWVMRLAAPRPRVKACPSISPR